MSPPTILPSFIDFKNEAKELFKNDSTIKKHGQALSKLSQKYGFKNWKTIRPHLIAESTKNEEVRSIPSGVLEDEFNEFFKSSLEKIEIEKPEHTITNRKKLSPDAEHVHSKMLPIQASDEKEIRDFMISISAIHTALDPMKIDIVPIKELISVGEALEQKIVTLDLYPSLLSGLSILYCYIGNMKKGASYAYHSASLGEILYKNGVNASIDGLAFDVCRDVAFTLCDFTHAQIFLESGEKNAFPDTFDYCMKPYLSRHIGGPTDRSTAFNREVESAISEGLFPEFYSLCATRQTFAELTAERFLERI